MGALHDITNRPAPDGPRPKAATVDTAGGAPPAPTPPPAEAAELEPPAETELEQVDDFLRSFRKLSFGALELGGAAAPEAEAHDPTADAGEQQQALDAEDSSASTASAGLGLGSPMLAFAKAKARLARSTIEADSLIGAWQAWQPAPDAATPAPGAAPTSLAGRPPVAQPLPASVLAGGATAAAATALLQQRLNLLPQHQRQHSLLLRERLAATMQLCQSLHEQVRAGMGWRLRRAAGWDASNPPFHPSAQLPNLPRSTRPAWPRSPPCGARTSGCPAACTRHGCVPHSGTPGGRAPCSPPPAPLPPTACPKTASQPPLSVRLSALQLDKEDLQATIRSLTQEAALLAEHARRALLPAPAPAPAAAGEVALTTPAAAAHAVPEEVGLTRDWSAALSVASSSGSACARQPGASWQPGTSVRCFDCASLAGGCHSSGAAAAATAEYVQGHAGDGGAAGDKRRKLAPGMLASCLRPAISAAIAELEEGQAGRQPTPGRTPKRKLRHVGSAAAAAVPGPAPAPGSPVAANASAPASACAANGASQQQQQVAAAAPVTALALKGEMRMVVAETEEFATFALLERGWHGRTPDKARARPVVPRRDSAAPCSIM